VHLLHSVRMEVESDQGLSLEGWLSRILSPLQNLLSLAAGRPVAVTGLFVYSPEISPTEKAPGDPIEVLCRARYCEAQPSDEWALADTVFTVRDMGKAFPEMMEQWLKIADELAAVCDMHFIVVYQPHTYLEHHFLSEVWALEAYHRRRYPNNVLSKAENRAKIRSILVGVPEEHHKWLEEQLAFSNEPRFAQRLEDLLKQADSAISPLVGDKGSFVRAVKDARTALVHHPYSPQRPASSTQPGQLHRLAWTLSFLVQALLLQELGFSSERSAELLSRNRRYVWLRRLARA
jgi:hypothetical protein